MDFSTKIEDLARMADLTHIYLTFYTIASDYVHGSINNFSNYLFHENGDNFVDYKPKVYDIKESLLNANYMAIIAIEAYSQFMKLDISEETLTSLSEELASLFEIVNKEKYDV